MVTNRWCSRWLACMAVVLVAMALTGCFDKQADQRKAFTGFLQNTVMRSGEVLPVLSADQKKQFGSLTAEYDVLYNYAGQVSQAMNEGIRPLVQTVNQIHQPQDYLTQRDTLRQLTDSLAVLNQQLVHAKSQADSAHAAQKLADDLRPVYDRAFAKIVTTPASALQPLLPAAQTLVQQLVQVGDFIAQQGDGATFSDKGIQFATQQQVDRYNTLIAPLASQYQAFEQAYNAAVTAIK